MWNGIRNEFHLAVLWGVAALFFLGHDGLPHVDGALATSLLFAGLFAAILWGAFAVVRHAEALARLLGEPYGTLVLTLSVTLIEVAFIISAELGGSVGMTLARDTVFSILMITINGMAGLCLLIGGFRYGEQEQNLQGTRSFLAVIVPVAVLALILPNYTTSPHGPMLSVFQSKFLAIVILLLYGVFLAIQTMRHPYFFEEAAARRNRVSKRLAKPSPPRERALFHGAIRILTLLPVVYLTDDLAGLTARGIGVIGAPTALAGVLVAVLVLAPEGMGALYAASCNQLQRAINIALGSALATVSLTIPAILAIGVWKGSGVALGLEAEEILLLALTFLVAPFTIGAARTNLLTGAVHLVLFLTFVALIFDP